MQQKNHIEPLTWLRGIAALLVIFSHSLRASNVSYGPGDPAADVAFFRAMDLGDFGVTLFFVLSGLSLYLSNPRAGGLHGALPFYIKRFFRIWPAFAAAVLAYAVFNTYFVAQYTPPSSYWIAQHSRPFGFEEILRYLSLTFNVTGPTGLFSGALWTLPVEFQFYLMFPFALWLAARWNAHLLLLMGAALLLAGGHDVVPMADHAVFTMAYAFLGGMYIGMTLQTRRLRLPWWLTLAVIVGLTVLVSLVQNKMVGLPALPILKSDRNIFILSAIIIVAMVFKTDFSIVPVVLRKAMSRYGEISYSTYLFHQLFVGATVLLFVRLGITGDIKSWIVLTITVTATLVVANFSFRYIEQPSIDLGRRLAARYSE